MTENPDASESVDDIQDAAALQEARRVDDGYRIDSAELRAELGI